MTDLSAIYDHTRDTWGAAQAVRYTRQIQSTCKGLLSGSRRSQQAEHIRLGYRKAAAGSHVIYFRETDEALIVVRILHVRMDPERHM